MAKKGTKKVTPKKSPADTARPRQSAAAKRKTTFEPILDKQNYIIIGVGVLLMFLGFILMSGGHNTDPSFFNAEGLYSTRIMVVSPLVIVLGVLVIVFGIFKKFSPEPSTEILKDTAAS